MSLLKKTKHLLSKYQITPKKHLSQNFLITPSIFEHLAGHVSLNQKDIVLEIGAGLGFLTAFLADRCKRLVAIESDLRLVKLLYEQLKDIHNVDIIKGDVLTAKVEPFNKVVSVPPYHISSPLLLWLFNREFKCAVLIFQKDFADRITAPVGSKNYGWLAVVTYCNAQVHLLKEIPRQMFYPQPNIDSVIVLLKSRKQPPFDLKDESFFRQLVQTFFTHRNRKVRNAARAFIKRRKIAVGEATVEIADSLPHHRKRVRELAPEDFGELANALQNQNSNHE